MGKLPGRWIKALIFGKKSPRSKNAKANDEKRGDCKQEQFSQDQIENTYLSLSISQRRERKIEESVLYNNPQDELRTPVPSNQDGCIVAATKQNAGNDSDRIREEQAATNVQSALRGYLARRAFRTLKGIIRLQALIRGHLVRRQAISTLFFMFQIVKFQALARGRKIRHSEIGVEVQKKCTRLNHLAIRLAGVDMSMKKLKLSSNGFARKILASSPTPMPLHFQYDESNETNSVFSWLDRWSTSHCWQLLPKPKADHRSKSQKPHTHKSLVINVESIASEFDKKPIRNFKKVAANEPGNCTEENPELVLERVKRNLRKVNNPILQSTELESEKKGEELSESKTTPDQLGVREAEKESELVQEAGLMMKGMKISKRRVSIPVKQEFMENNEPQQIEHSVPSYMAATISAKAKLKGGQAGTETPYTLTRRHSLPSMTNVKVSFPPRIRTTGKLKNDRSLQLSRDGNVSLKVNQAEWRR